MMSFFFVLLVLSVMNSCLFCHFMSLSDALGNVVCDLGVSWGRGVCLRGGEGGGGGGGEGSPLSVV